MSFFKKTLKSLFNTSKNFKNIFLPFSNKKKLSQNDIEELEDILLESDIGWELSEILIDKMKILEDRFDCWEDQLINIVLKEINYNLGKQELSKVILIVGVNGTGKTTSAAKLANFYNKQDEKVLLVAADTYRAAAVEQLEIWSNKVGVRLISNKLSNDSASIVFDGIKSGLSKDYDRIIIDTAGRMQNSKNLMNELEKIYRVGTKLVNRCEIFLTVDANFGQNALSQVESFNSKIPLSGIILTKLDGTAKGGIVLPIMKKYSIPIYFNGIGEGLDDLVPFNFNEYLNALLGKEEL
tara:strand:- start:863 stop:1750 length:888 start_codon:yes stop_codon:yes gene_type:complete